MLSLKKTGYPSDMLQPEMELDADLGIDSIKRVEIMSALQEKLPNLPTIGPDRMSMIRSLKDIIVLMTQEAGPTTTSPQPGSVSTSSLPTGEKVVESTAHGITPTILLEVVSNKTGYPADLLELDMELDGDLGIDSIKRVEIMSALQEKLPEMSAISPDRMAQIRTLRDVYDAMTKKPEPTIDSIRSTSESTRISPFDTKPIAIRRDTGTSISSAIVRDVIAQKTGYPRGSSRTRHEYGRRFGY